MKAKNPLKVTGKPILYDPISYPVEHGLGPAFMEKMEPGVATDRSGNRDTLFLVNHGSGGTLPLARESAGTLRLADTPSALTFNADLDPASTLASDLARAIARKDLTQMSVGFRVLDDEWSDDFMNRTVRASHRALGCVGRQPAASPQTSISLVPPETAAKKKPDDDLGGPYGTQNAPYPYGGTMGGDGTGTRDKSRWSNAERRARAGGVERRAHLAGTLRDSGIHGLDAESRGGSRRGATREATQRRPPPRTGALPAATAAGRHGR